MSYISFYLLASLYYEFLYEMVITKQLLGVYITHKLNKTKLSFSDFDFKKMWMMKKISKHIEAEERWRILLYLSFSSLFAFSMFVLHNVVPL